MRKRSFRLRRTAATALACLTLLTFPAGWIPPRRPAPEACLLDMGAGLCMVLRGTDGTGVLYDCGSLHQEDPSGRTILPALRHLGVRRIETLILSHPDADHTNGLPGLLERIPVDRIVTTPYAPATPEGRERILEIARSHGIPVRMPTPGEAIPAPPGIRLTALGPPPPTGEAGSLPSNDTSLSVRAELEGIAWRVRGFRIDAPDPPRPIEASPLRILLTGDLDDLGIDRLLDAAPSEQLAAEILAVPHHGSAVRGTGRLLETVRPRQAWNSTRAGFPAAATLRAYRENGVPLLSTDRWGAIQLVPGGGFPERP